MEPEYFGHLLTHTKRPVYFSRRVQLPRDLPIALRQEFLIYRAVQKNGPEPFAPTWPEDKLESSGWHWALDYTTRSIDAEIHAKRAEYFMGIGDWERADRDVAYARETLPEVAILNNLGTLLARHKKNERAIELLEEALKIEPRNATLQRNLEKVQQRLAESDLSDVSDKSDASDAETATAVSPRNDPAPSPGSSPSPQ